MYSTSYRRKLEECLSDLLAPGTKVKSSTLLQAYSTFYAISKEYPSKFSDAYIKVKKSGLSCRLGFLFIPRPPIEVPPAFDLFLKLSPEQFFRFIVPDLVGDPARLMQRFRTKYEENILLLAHRIVQVRRVVYILFSSDNDTKITDSDCYEEAVDKIYNAYCKLEDANKLTRSEFLDFYQLINLYPLDVDETRVSYNGYDKKDLLMVMDLFSNEIELSREQQINVLHRFFVKRHQIEQILDYCRPFHFTRKKDYDSRKKLLRNALLKVASIPPLDALCAVTLYKKTTVNSLLETSTIKNDVSLENGLIYTLFTSRTLLSLTDDNDFVIFFPSTFFVKKWIADKETKGKNASFVFTSSALSDLINYHYRAGSYANDPGKNVSFFSVEEWKSRVLSSPENRLTHKTKVLLFACNMSTTHQREWYQFVKEQTESTVDMFILLSSYEFEQANSPFSSELDDLHVSISSVEIIPQGINNSTSPRRKMFLQCTYNKNEHASGLTKVFAYTLNTDLKTQALSRMLDEPVEISQHNLVGLYGSIRMLYQKELLERKASGRKNVAAFSHEFTPDITVWCSKTYPKNNKGRPRLEAYICRPADLDRTANGFQERGKVIVETKKHTVKIHDENITNWLENEYPYSIVQARHSHKEMKEIEGPCRLKPAVNIREEIIVNYSPYLLGQNIALKTFWYLYPDLEHLFSKRDYTLFGQMACSEIGFLRVGDIDPEVCEELLPNCYPNETRDDLLHRIKILSRALDKAVSCAYCEKNLLQKTVHDRHLREKLFSQVRRALVKKHFTETELLKAFDAIVSKIRDGYCEYLGVLIRLLTGLESNIVCALKWKDICKIPIHDISKIVVTRQLSNDGNEVKGFNSLEDYLCFPVTPLLMEFLEGQKNLIRKYLPDWVNVQEIPVVSTMENLVGEKTRYKAFPPRELEKLSKEILKQVGIADHIVEIPDAEHGTKETNLNRYGGDFFRENFRHWALQHACLLPDEVNYLIGNKPETTFGTFYCDFIHDTSQLTLFVKLSRWDAFFENERSAYALSCSSSETRCFSKVFHPVSNNPLRLHIRLVSLEECDRICVKAESRYGVVVETAPLLTLSDLEVE